MTTKGDAVDPGPASPPDLDVWRAEAGEAAVMAATATPGPWCFDGYSSIDSEPTGSTVCQMPRPRSGGDIATIQGQDDAHFASAARTGWPRDAARVAALCERVAALEAHVATLDAMKAIGDWQEALAARCEVLEAALSEALDEFEDAIQYKLEYLVTKHGDRETLARLRAIAAGTAGEEPTK